MSDGPISVGDVVECLDNDWPRHRFRKGAIYTVTSAMPPPPGSACFHPLDIFGLFPFHREQNGRGCTYLTFAEVVPSEAGFGYGSCSFRRVSRRKDFEALLRRLKQPSPARRKFQEDLTVKAPKVEA